MKTKIFPALRLIAAAFLGFLLVGVLGFVAQHGALIAQRQAAPKLAATFGPTTPTFVMQPQAVNALTLGVSGNGTTDDHVAIQSALTSLAGSGKALWIPGPNTYSIGLQITPPNNSLFLGSLGASFVSTISDADAGPYSSIFSRDATQAANGNTGTLASTPAIGALTISVTMAFKPAVNDWLMISHATSAETFLVLSVTGSSSPYTVTIADSNGNGEPTGLPWASGDTVVEYINKPIGITLDGQGMTLSGSGNQAMEFPRSEHVVIRNFLLNPSSGTTGIGFDLGGRENLIENVFANVQGSGAQLGFYMQSNDRTVFRRLRSTGAQYGMQIIDSVQSGYEDCWAYHVNRGLMFASLPLAGASSLGNFGVWSRGGGCVDCGIGFDIYGSSGADVESFTAQGSATYGILVENVANTPSTANTTIRGCRTQNCAVGVFVASGPTGTIIRDHNADGCTTNALNSQGDMVVDGFSAVLPIGASPGVQVSSSARLNKIVISGTAIAIQFNTTISTVKDSILSPTDLSLYVVSGAVFAENVTTTGNRGAYITAGASLTIGPGCDFSGSTTPISFAGGGAVSMVQTGGVAAISGSSASVSLTFTQHYNTAVELASGAGNSVTVTTYPIPGLTFTARNLSASKTLTMQTTNSGTVTVASSKSAVAQVNAAGVMVRVTPDT